MLPRLRASEALDDFTRTAVGSGNASEHGPSILASWRMQSETPRARAARIAQQRRQRPTAESIARLGAMGYGVRKVPAKPKPQPEA